MMRDSKGRFCSSKSIKNESSLEYQKKLKEAIKLILDCTTKKEYNNVPKYCTPFNACSINYTGNKDDLEFKIDYITYFELTTLYNMLNNK